MSNIGLVVLFVSALVLCHAALPPGYDYLPSHKRSLTDSGTIRVTIALKNRNVDKLEKIFWDVNDPKSSNYGNHLTFDEMVDLVAPHQDSIDSVINWVTASGIEKDKITLRESKDFLNIQMSVPQAETLFNTPQIHLVHKKTGQVAVKMEGYNLPHHVHPLVDFVSDLHDVRNVPLVSLAVEEIKPNDILRQVVLDVSLNSATFKVYPQCGDIHEYPLPSSPNLIQCPGGVTLIHYNVAVTEQIRNTELMNLNMGYECDISLSDGLPVTCIVDKIQNIPYYLPFTVNITAVYSDGFRRVEFTSDTLLCPEDITPDVLKRTYNIPRDIRVTQKSNSQAVGQFYRESFLMSDAQAYFKHYNLPDMTNFIQIQNKENFIPTDPGDGEGILDIVAIMGTARTCKTYYWVEGAGEASSFYNYAQEILNSRNPPLVHSLSWGAIESYDNITTIPRNNSVRANTEFIKAGARGLTIIVASGDSGTGIPISIFLPKLPPVLPTFPASSPYVTSVGGTQIFPASTDPSCYTDKFEYTCGLREITCSTETGAKITSGGGFSGLFSRPSYQDAAVSAYLSSNAVPSEANITNRGYPDVSIFAHNIPVVYNGTLRHFDGTSASSPFFAGMVTLLNDIRLSQGKPSLGFINPLLYSLNESFYFDVTVGSSKCAPNQFKCDVGFNASKGWDAVTGLGSPNFAKLAEYVTQLGTYEPIPRTTSGAPSLLPSITFFIFAAFVMTY